MLAALPLFPIEADHDTEADPERPKSIRRWRRAQPIEDTRESTKAHFLRPLRLGVPIAPAAQLAAASLSRLRVREAQVKIQAGAKAQETPKSPAPAPTRVPDLRIAWLRSNAPGLKLTRFGADGFAIDGVAEGEGRASVAVDGLIFTIAIRPGECAASVLDTFSRRLGAGFRVEVLELAASRARARLASHT